MALQRPPAWGDGASSTTTESRHYSTSADEPTTGSVGTILKGMNTPTCTVNILDLQLATLADEPTFGQCALVDAVHRAFDAGNTVIGRDIYGHTGPLYRHADGAIWISP